MNNPLKNILQVFLVVILLAGVVYLGYKLISLKNTSSPITTQITSTTNVDTNDNPNDSNSTPVDAGQCNSSDDCTVVSESLRKGGDTKAVIQCLNKAYLSTCDACSTSETMVAETTKEAACGCVQNLCQFDLLAK